MKRSFLLPVLLLMASIGVIAFFMYTLRISSPNISQNSPCIPTFPDGDGPYYINDVPFRNNLASPNTKGEKLIVKGRVLKHDCRTPVQNVVLNIWHADENGRYQNDWYRGKITSGFDGSYSFETVMPKGYGKGTGYRPPHIHFKVFINNQVLITSEMFFPEVRGKPGFNDGYIVRLGEANIWGKKVNRAHHDIILPF